MTDDAELTPTGDEDSVERAAQLQAAFEAWWAERKAKGLALQRSSRRVWAAMEGWGAVQTQEDWERVRAETAEDWASGRALVEMLGGDRYIEPRHAALVLHLWRHFVIAYEVDGPAEYLCVAMALVSFYHFLRLNELVGNISVRLEDEFFHTEGLRAKFERKYAGGGTVRELYVEELARQLGRDLLPLLDRLNRMMIRNLKMLRDLKTTPLALTVENYGQLNVGQQQTNLTQPPATADERQG